ncbi:MAG: hypothetical protein CM1200mP16_02990 [Nitrospina sp.]|nr:MAG: hypothetical protein CM1200mP16_02990 [Nitrospina sp.]
MVPVTIIGSGEIIKKGSAIINPGSVQIILSSPVRKHLEEKDDGKILNSIRATILENPQQALLEKEAKTFKFYSLLKHYFFSFCMNSQIVAGCSRKSSWFFFPKTSDHSSFI